MDKNTFSLELIQGALLTGGKVWGRSHQGVWAPLPHLSQQHFFPALLIDANRSILKTRPKSKTLYNKQFIPIAMFQKRCVIIELLFSHYICSELKKRMEKSQENSLENC